MADGPSDSLVCSPRYSPNGHEYDQAAGSTFDFCERCGREVMVAPSGRRMIRERDLEIVCIPCAMADPEAEFSPPEPEQIEEVRRHFQLRPPV